MAVRAPEEINHMLGGFDSRNYQTEDGEFDFTKYLVE
jgi:hypothetical protein